MKSSFRARMLGLCLLSASSALSGVALAEGPAAPFYGLKAGDVLEISVWRETDMTKEVTVRPDGGISFPLAGDIPVVGRSTEDVRQELNNRLKNFISNPEVSVAVKEAAGNVVYVVGKVNKPGEFPMRGDVDVMQAIGMAGGTATFAKVDDIVVLRRDNGEQRAYAFHYGQVEAGRNLTQNFILKAGDVVVVP